jgi:hypothetical protein
MKRIAIGAAVVALSAAGLVATAGAANAGPGQDMKECFGTNYGQSALKFSDTKGAHPGGNIGPYGLAQLMAAHGPDGAAPLCS